jgi:hypothetical protein
MHKMLRFLGALVVVFGIIGLVVGITVFYMAYDKQAWMADAMRQEKVQLAALGVKGAGPDQVIDSASTAQAAADTVRAHRHSIAPTYSDLMAGGKYDPTNLKHLTYAQAMNLENYLYLGVLGFGVAQLAMGLGAFMVMTGLALGVIGISMFRLASQLKAA